jgi:hypothetical protein
MLSYARFEPSMLVVGCVALLPGCEDDDESSGVGNHAKTPRFDLGTRDRQNSICGSPAR